MDLRKIIALTLVIPTLRVYATGAESVENNTTEQEEKINNTTEQEKKILKKMQAILTDPKLKKEVVKSIYEPTGLSDNYQALKKELTAYSYITTTDTQRAQRINEIIKKIDDPILKAMGRNILFIHRFSKHLFRKYKKYSLNYIEMLTMNRGEFPYIPPSVGIEQMKEITEYFNNKIDENFIINDALVEKSEQMLDQCNVFFNMQEMKRIAKLRVEKQADAKLINLDHCEQLIATATVSSDIVKMILNDQYLRELITKAICKLAIADIEKIQATSYDKFVLALQGTSYSLTLYHLATQYVEEGRIADQFLHNIARVLGEQSHSKLYRPLFLDEVIQYFNLTTQYNQIKDNIRSDIKQKIDEQTQKFIDYVPTILTSETMYELGYNRLFDLNAEIAKIISNKK